MTERRLRVAIGVLALAGLAVAAYLTWVHSRPDALVCLTGGGCETVQSSSYSELGGIPVALLGALAYLAVLGSALARGLWVAAGAVAVALGGLVFALWLVYVQAAVLDAWCSWCVTSDVVLGLLAAACVARLLALAEPGG